MTAQVETSVMSFMDLVSNSNSVNLWEEKLPLNKMTITSEMPTVFFYGGPDRQGNGYNASITVGKNKDGKNISLSTTFQVPFYKANQEFINSVAVEYAEDDSRVDTTYQKTITDWLSGKEVTIKVEDENGNKVEQSFKLDKPVEVACFDAADANGKYPVREKDSKYHKKGERIFENFTLGYFSGVDPAQKRPKDVLANEANIG